MTLNNVLKITDAEYNRRPEIRNSELSHIARSPLHYRHYKDNGSLQTKAMEFGSLVHLFVLEPDLIDSNIQVVPKNTRKATVQTNKIIVSEQDYHRAENLSFSLLENDSVQNLLSQGNREYSYFAEHWDSGLNLKCKGDLVDTSRKMIVDLKTTESARPMDFKRSIKDYRYDVQAAFYTDIISWATGINIDTFCFIACEKVKPYAFTIYEMTAKELQYGREKYEKNLKTLAKCIKESRWPSYNDEKVYLIGGDNMEHDQ